MRFLIDVLVIIVFVTTAIFLYQQYWDDVRDTFSNEHAEQTTYIGSVAISISVADEPDERTLGLSKVRSLRDLEGKLFIFDTDAKHGIWMKDMLIPIDIIWINKDLEVVHIAQNVLPSTYPEVFAPPQDARFVLEMNAYFVSSYKIKVGDRLTLPTALLPSDIRKDLQQ